MIVMARRGGRGCRCACMGLLFVLTAWAWAKIHVWAARPMGGESRLCNVCPSIGHVPVQVGPEVAINLTLILTLTLTQYSRRLLLI